MENFYKFYLPVETILYTGTEANRMHLVMISKGL